MYGFYSFYFFFFLFYIVYALLLIVAYEKAKSKYKRRMLLVGMFIPLFLLAALRGISVGGDLEYYIPYFEESCRAKTIEETLSVSGHEPGYLLLSKIIGIIIPDNRFYLIVTSFISLLGPFFFIYRCSPSPIISLLMYYSMGFYTNTFNNVRQSMAMSLVFIAYTYLLINNKKIYFILSILASSIHFSALIALLCYPLFKKRIGCKMQMYLLAASSVLFVLFGSSFLLYFINIINLYYVKYDGDNNLIISSDSAGWGMLALYFLIYMYILYLFYAERKRLSVEAKIICKLILLCQLFSVIIQMYSTLFPSMLRVTSYFFIPIVISLPYLYSVSHNKVIKLSVAVVSFLLCTIFFTFTYNYSSVTNSNSQGVIPYVFIDTVVF